MKLMVVMKQCEISLGLIYNPRPLLKDFVLPEKGF